MKIEESLPIYKHRQEILGALEKNRVIVIESPTGSGKSTQLPIILYEAGYADQKRIGITQPRRIATTSISAFVDIELDAPEQNLVGYKIRFEDSTTPQTKIKFVTDGTLLQEIKHDPLLTEYSIIMVDEAHERSMNIDFTLGLLKRILAQRDDLKVIISSATINARAFSEYFGNCEIVSIDTKTYPVELLYSPVVEDDSDSPVITHINNTVAEHFKNHGADGQAMLIFLSGEAQIRECVRMLKMQPFAEHLFVLPLFSRLGSVEQQQIFLPGPEGKMKVVVATNIAETSVTINEITAVIDSGLAKLNYFTPHSNSFVLEEYSISQSSANQRMGRAGRTRPGVCYRLYKEEDFSERPQFTTEEIFRTDLSEVILRMAELNITDFTAFDFIASPDESRIIGAVESLKRIGVLTADNELTDIGRRMIAFPLLPRHSRIIIEAIMHFPEVIEECICVVSFLTSHGPFLSVDNDEIEKARAAQRRLLHDEGDFVGYPDIFNRYQQSEDKEAFCTEYYLDIKIMNEIVNVNQQLTEIVSALGVPISSGGGTAQYMASVCSGLMDTICAKTGAQSYQSGKLRNIAIHPGSLLWGTQPDLIVAGEIVRTTRTYARFASPLNVEWLTNFSSAQREELALLEKKAKSARIRNEARRKARGRGRGRGLGQDDGRGRSGSRRRGSTLGQDDGRGRSDSRRQNGDASGGNSSRDRGDGRGNEHGYSDGRRSRSDDGARRSQGRVRRSQGSDDGARRSQGRDGARSRDGAWAQDHDGGRSGDDSDSYHTTRGRDSGIRARDTEDRGSIDKRHSRRSAARAHDSERDEQFGGRRGRNSASGEERGGRYGARRGRSDERADEHGGRYRGPRGRSSARDDERGGRFEGRRGRNNARADERSDLFESPRGRNGERDGHSGLRGRSDRGSERDSMQADKWRNKNSRSSARRHNGGRDVWKQDEDAHVDSRVTRGNSGRRDMRKHNESSPDGARKSFWSIFSKRNSQNDGGKRRNQRISARAYDGERDDRFGVPRGRRDERTDRFGVPRRRKRAHDGERDGRSSERDGTRRPRFAGERNGRNSERADQFGAPRSRKRTHDGERDDRFGAPRGRRDERSSERGGTRRPRFAGGRDGRSSERDGRSSGGTARFGASRRRKRTHDGEREDRFGAPRGRRDERSSERGGTRRPRFAGARNGGRRDGNRSSRDNSQRRGRSGGGRNDARGRQ